MMRSTSPFRFITLWTVLGTLAVFIVLLVIWGLILLNAASAQVAPSASTAVVQIIPPPTSTSPVIATIPPTATAKPEFTTPVANSQIQIGDYVQIANTGGDGLRIRTGPGTGNAPIFLGMESEVFKVTDGPKESDGYIWWYLVAPYDNTRAGWAAANFLTVVAQQP